MKVYLVRTYFVDVAPGTCYGQTDGTPACFIPGRGRDRKKALQGLRECVFHVSIPRSCPAAVHTWRPIAAFPEAEAFERK